MSLVLDPQGILWCNNTQVGAWDKVTVDSHEASNHPEIVRRLGNLAHVVSLSNLPGRLSIGGDFLIISNQRKVIGIQRKTMNDLWSSTWDGRLVEDVALMSENYDEAWLLTEGEWGSILDPNEPQSKAILTTLDTLQRKHGLMLRWRPDLEATIEALMDWWDYYHRPHDTLRERSKVKLKKLSPYDGALAGIPGWGPVLRAKAIQTFGTPKEVIEAAYNKPKSLLKVPGLGKEKLEALYRTFGGKL